MKTNYRNNYKKETENNKVEETSVVVREAVQIEGFTLPKGTVVNCDFLNIRKEPSLQADVLKIVPRGARLNVVPDYANDDFYKIKIIDGEYIGTGYCVKTFLEVIRTDE